MTAENGQTENIVHIKVLPETYKTVSAYCDAQGLNESFVMTLRFLNQISIIPLEQDEKTQIGKTLKFSGDQLPAFIRFFC